MRHFNLLIAGLLFTIPVAAQTKDISGTWVAKVQSPTGVEREYVYRLPVKDGKITGTQTMPPGDSPIVDGKITGDQFEFTVEMESLGNITKRITKGKIVGDELHIAPAAPGHWNDPDMLPLIAGNDLRNMTAETKEILLNREVIAVDQDKLGKAGTQIAKDGDKEVWAKPLDKGAYAVGLFNRGTEAADITVKWSDLQLKGKPKVRDLWAHADRGSVADRFTAKVPAHGVVMIRVAK